MQPLIFTWVSLISPARNATPPRPIKIAGSSTTSSVSEGGVSCTDCHNPNPHDSRFPLLRKLNEHGMAMACQTCHIPQYAVNKFTLTYRDGSRISQKTEMVMETPEKREFKTLMGQKILEKNLRPAYAWYNGKHYRYMKGDPVAPKGISAFKTRPMAVFDDPSGKNNPPTKSLKPVRPFDALL